MRLENTTIFEECLPSHVMLSELFIRKLDEQQWLKRSVSCPSAARPILISVGHHSRPSDPRQTTDANVERHSLHNFYPTKLAPGQISMSCGTLGWTLLEPRGISFTADTNNSLGSPALCKWVQSKFVASAHLFQGGSCTQGWAPGEARCLASLTRSAGLNLTIYSVWRNEIRREEKNCKASELFVLGPEWSAWPCRREWGAIYRQTAAGILLTVLWSRRAAPQISFLVPYLTIRRLSAR